MKAWMHLPMALALVGIASGGLAILWSSPALFAAGALTYAASYFVEGRDK